MNLLKILPIVLILFVSGCAAYQSPSTPTPQQGTPTQPEQSTETPQEGTLQGEVTQEQPPALPIVYTIEITPTGFSPKTLTIASGDMVTFVNKDTAPHWPASAVHPTHCEYKGCGVFDAKKGLNTGENYSIVFDLAGSWKYHDHLNSGMTGTIVVQ